jgi:hypothetical protein
LEPVSIGRPPLVSLTLAGAAVCSKVQQQNTCWALPPPGQLGDAINGPELDLVYWGVNILQHRINFAATPHTTESCELSPRYFKPLVPLAGIKPLLILHFK